MMRGEKEIFGGMYDGGESIPNMGGGEGEPKAGGEGEPKAGGEGFAVPTEYQEKGWAKDLKSHEDVFKKLDGAETLIGQRPAEGIQIPKDGATPEEMATFYNSLGRPTESKDYSFNREGQSDAMKEFNSEEMDVATKAIFHKYGLRPDQASGIQTDYEALLGEAYKEQVETQQKLNSEFDAATTKAFGNDKESVIENAKILLQHHTPKGFEDKIKSLDNETLTVMAGVLNDIKSKYISEDVFSNLGKGGGGHGNSKEDLRTEARKLMVSKEFTDAFNPDHDKVKAEVAKIYEDISKLD